MSKFKVGDRVCAIKAVTGVEDLIGKIGTVIVIDRASSLCDIGVEFDERFGCGHDCDGECKNGHGRHGSFDEFELIESVKVVDNKLLTADELLDYIKVNGITKVKLTKKFKPGNCPLGTILYFGVGSGGSDISAYNEDTNNLNKQFGYNFDYEGGFYYHSNYDGKFEIIDFKEKLIKINMDIEEIKEFPKNVLVEAEKQAKKDLAKDQTEIATAKFKELFKQISDAELEVTKAQKKLSDLRGKIKTVIPKK